MILKTQILSEKLYENQKIPPRTTKKGLVFWKCALAIPKRACIVYCVFTYLAI